MKQYRLIILQLVLLCFFGSCDKKKAKEPAPETPVTPPACAPKYNDDIKPFIVAKCALSGCHVQGASIGDFTTYAALKARVDNGRVNSMVFELKIMPPASSVKLTTEEQDKLKCWMNNGAPQN